MKKFLIVAFLSALPSLAFAQAAAPTDKFAWTMDYPIAVSQAFRYDLEIDGVVRPTVPVVTCVGTVAPVECSTPIPAITPSQHTARVRAVDVGGSTPILGEWSDLLTFTMRAVPTKPRNLKITSANGGL